MVYSPGLSEGLGSKLVRLLPLQNESEHPMGFTLKADVRSVTGKKVKHLRTSGTVPAVLYGKDMETVSLQMSSREFDSAFRNVAKGQPLTLQVGETSYNVVIQLVQRHPLSRAIVHVDFKLA